MEILNVITNLISNVGFPIAMCLVMFFFLRKQQDAHKEEMEHLKQSLDNNTEAIRELKYRIKGGEFDD